MPHDRAFKPGFSGYYNDNASNLIQFATYYGDEALGYVSLVTATPEPASMVLLATGLLGIGGFARRRRKA